MKYKLGFYQNDSLSNKFIPIPLYLVHEKFENNDLKEICNFTMNFSDSNDLKLFLINKMAKLRKYENYSIGIIDSRGKILDVPYKKHKMLFNVNILLDLIYKHINNINFCYNFLAPFRNREYLKIEVNELLQMVNGNQANYLIEYAVGNLVRKICYKKNKLQYRELYKLVMHSMRVIDALKEKEKIVEREEVIFSKKLNEVEEFELEWLKARARILVKNPTLF